MLPIYDVHSVQNRLQDGNKSGQPASERRRGPDFAKVLNAEILRAAATDPQDGGAGRGTLAISEATLQRGSSVQLDEIARAAENTAAALGDRLVRVFGEADVDLDREIVLVAAPSGRVRVANGHPDSARIDEIVSSSPGIASDVALIAAGVSLLRAVSEHRAFMDLYQLDPSAAATRQAKTDTILSHGRLHISLDDGALRVFLAPEPARFDRAPSAEKRIA